MTSRRTRRRDAADAAPVVGKVDRALRWYARASLVCLALLLLIVGGRWAPAVAPLVVVGIFASAGRSGPRYRLLAAVLAAVLAFATLAPFAAALVGGGPGGLLLAAPIAIAIGAAIARRRS